MEPYLYPMLYPRLNLGTQEPDSNPKRALLREWLYPSTPFDKLRINRSG